MFRGARRGLCAITEPMAAERRVYASKLASVRSQNVNTNVRPSRHETRPIGEPRAAALRAHTIETGVGRSQNVNTRVPHFEARGEASAHQRAVNCCVAKQPTEGENGTRQGDERREFTALTCMSVRTQRSDCKEQEAQRNEGGGATPMNAARLARKSVDWRFRLDAAAIR